VPPRGGKGPRKGRKGYLPQGGEGELGRARLFIPSNGGRSEKTPSGGGGRRIPPFFLRIKRGEGKKGEAGQY